jgi:hypothetical protein
MMLTPLPPLLLLAGRDGKLARGGLPDESGEAFVFIDNRYPIEV